MRARLPAHAAPISRWGLLLTTFALVVALLGTALSSYIAVQTAFASLVRSAAMDAVATARRSLHAAGGPTPEVLEDVLTTLADDGVRYIAVVDGGGATVASAGEPAPAPSWVPARDRGPAAGIERSRDGTRARASGPYVGPGGGVSWRSRMTGLADAGPPEAGLAEGLIRVELEPLALHDLTAHALANLLIAAFAGIVLLAAAVVFWRMSQRSQREAAQLERDRRLKTLGQMSAVLGHELRNPLAGLKGHAQLILRKLPEQHPARNDAETVVREAVRLETLANQVLELARTGKVQPHPEDPLLVARGALEAVASERVHLESRPERLPLWPLDRSRMEQVLTNLLRNAVQASPEDGPVELAAFVERDETLVFEIRDRGEGLAPGDEQAVFEPFFTRRAKGSGLGLTLARQIVEGHGGHIEASRRKGGGAVFRVAIPRREA